MRFTTPPAWVTPDGAPRFARSRASTNGGCPAAGPARRESWNGLDTSLFVGAHTSVRRLRLVFAMLSTPPAEVRRTVGIPKEIYPREQRVGATPSSVSRLIALGFDVAVESQAGLASSFDDGAYQQAGARVVVSAKELYAAADWVLKVRAPMASDRLGMDEADAMREGTTLVCFLWPANNGDLVERLRARNITSFGMDCVPRTTRAQKLDALSAMANLVGYRAVLEAAGHYGKLLGGQTTAAGTVKPAKVFVIGAGVAGLAAVGAARSLGAVVRAFDTRTAAREQVESMGARFVALTFDESGDGVGGYAKQMSAAYLKAEQDLIAQHCQDCDIVISTALIPGALAPELITAGAVLGMQRGSVIIDLAAEQGGNCALTKVDQMVDPYGVKILGFTDFASRMARQASELFATTLVNLVDEVTTNTELTLNLEDPIHRGVIVTRNREVLWPPPKLAVVPPPKLAAPTRDAKARRQEERKHGSASLSAGAVLTLGLAVAGLTLSGAAFGDALLFQHVAIFVLACIVGWRIVWNVTPALHTPLMSVTNAISGIILVGGMMLMRGGVITATTILGAIAVFVAVINVTGGFFVTQRMLQMFRK